MTKGTFGDSFFNETETQIINHVRVLQKKHGGQNVSQETVDEHLNQLDQLMIKSKEEKAVVSERQQQEAYFFLAIHNPYNEEHVGNFTSSITPSMPAQMLADAYALGRLATDKQVFSNMLAPLYMQTSDKIICMLNDGDYRTHGAKGLINTIQDTYKKYKIDMKPEGKAVLESAMTSGMQKRVARFFNSKNTMKDSEEDIYKTNKEIPTNSSFAKSCLKFSDAIHTIVGSSGLTRAGQAIHLNGWN